MPWGRRYRRRKPKTRRPRDVEDGLKLRSRRGAVGATWWSERFIAVLESFAIGSRLRRGRAYARGGQVLEYDIGAGLARARVQGSRRDPYRVEIRVRTLPESAWGRVEEALASQALFAARLLGGEMPQEIEATFAALDLSLFPTSAGELETECSCPDFANPCKHIAATYYLLAEAFDEDPFLIFAWRGRERADLIARLRALRGDAAADPAAPPPGAAEPTVPMQPAPPLEAALGDFWALDPAFEGAHVVPRASDTPDALLRQLGAPPAEAGGRASFDRLAAAYRAMAAGAERLAYDGAGNGDGAAATAHGNREEDGDRADGGATPAARAAVDRDRPPGREVDAARGTVNARTRARSYVTDLGDLLFEDDDDVPAAARRAHDFFGTIVRIATSIPPDEERWSPLRCLRGRGRHACQGRVRVRLVAATSEIVWRCSGCGDDGVIRGWECSIHDLGGPAQEDAATIGLALSEADYRLLAGLELVDIDAEQLVRAAHYLPPDPDDDDAYDNDLDVVLIGVPDAFRALSAELETASRLERSASRRRRLLRLHSSLEPPDER